MEQKAQIGVFGGSGFYSFLEDVEEIAVEKPTKKRFTQEEIKFLKENKDKLSNEELAKELGRSIDSITHKLSRLGIARESYEWTTIKDKFLKKFITKLSYRQLAEKLGTTVPSVRARCKKLDIRK